MKIGRVSKKHIALIIITIVAILMFFFIQINGVKSNGPESIVKIGNIVFPLNTIQGLLQNIVLLGCICCSCLDCNKGFAIGMTITIVSFLATLLQVVLGNNAYVLPGLAMCILTIIVMNVISYLLRIAQRNSITDIMTGLKNQRGFLYTLQPMIGRKKGAIAYLLLNNYRAINDEFGHEIGDKILKVVGKKIQDKLGEDGEVYRNNGAVFSILFKEGVNAEKSIEEIIELLSDEIRVTVDDMSIKYYGECNAGVMYFDETATSKDKVTKCADVALMNACKMGMNKYAVYNESMSQEEIEDKKIEQMIKDALKNELFYLVYQPQYFVEGKKIRGFEALIRLRDEEGNVVSPGKFIPVAEKNTLIYNIDEYVLKYVAKEFAPIAREHSDIRISVNISANGFAREEFVPKVKKILDEYDFPYGSLEIEITEYSMSKAPAITMKNIEDLHELGIFIALDDFGTGYTTLAKLVELKANVLKIDKSIVDMIECTEVHRKFVKNIGDMGHLLDCEVLLEGVETDDQVEFIKEMKCDCIQGFVWGRPISFEEALTKLD